MQRIGGSFYISKQVSLHLPRARVMIGTEDLKAMVSDSRKLICDTLFIMQSTQYPYSNNNVNKPSRRKSTPSSIIHPGKLCGPCCLCRKSQSTYTHLPNMQEELVRCLLAIQQVGHTDCIWVIADGINQSYIISKRLIWRWPNPNCSHRPLAVELLQVSSKLIWYTTHRSNAWSCPSKEVSIHKLVPSLSVVLPFAIAQFNMLIQQHTTQCSELFAWPQFSSKEKFDWPCIKFEQAWSS